MSEPQPLFNRITYAGTEDATARCESCKKSFLLCMRQLETLEALEKRFLDHGVVFCMCSENPGQAVHFLFNPPKSTVHF